MSNKNKNKNKNVNKEEADAEHVEAAAPQVKSIEDLEEKEEVIDPAEGATPVGPKKGVTIVGGEKGQPIPHGLTAKDMETVTVICDPPVFINGIKYEGNCKMPRHMAQSVVPMIQAKRRTDLESITGKSYLVEKLADGSRIIKDQGEVK